MEDMRAFGTAPSSTPTDRGCPWRRSCAPATTSSSAPPQSSSARTLRPSTGTTHTRSTTASFGAGTWTKNTAWNSSEPSTSQCLLQDLFSFWGSLFVRCSCRKCTLVLLNCVSTTRLLLKSFLPSGTASFLGISLELITNN
jgi:hypothetical protein